MSLIIRIRDGLVLLSLGATRLTMGCDADQSASRFEPPNARQHARFRTWKKMSRRT